MFRSATRFLTYLAFAQSLPPQGQLHLQLRRGFKGYYKCFITHTHIVGDNLNYGRKIIEMKVTCE